MREKVDAALSKLKKQKRFAVAALETFDTGHYYFYYFYKKASPKIHSLLLSKAAGKYKSVKEENKESFCKLYAFLIQALMCEGKDREVIRHYSNLYSIDPEGMKEIPSNFIDTYKSICSSKNESKSKKIRYYHIHAYCHFMLNKKNIKKYGIDSDPAIKMLDEAIKLQKTKLTYELRSYIYYCVQDYTKALRDAKLFLFLAWKRKGKDTESLALAYLRCAIVRYKLGVKSYKYAIEDCNMASKVNRGIVEKFKKIDHDKNPHYKSAPIDYFLSVTMTDLIHSLLNKLLDEVSLLKEEIEFMRNNEDILESLLFRSDTPQSTPFNPESMQLIEKKLLAAYNSQNIFKVFRLIPIGDSLQEKFSIYATATARNTRS